MSLFVLGVLSGDKLTLAESSVFVALSGRTKLFIFRIGQLTGRGSYGGEGWRGGEWAGFMCSQGVRRQCF